MSTLVPGPERRKPVPRQPSSNLGTAIALFGMLLISGALLGLMSLVLPQVAGVMLVVLLVFVFPISVHYLVWGRWLSRRQERDLRESE